MFHNVAENGCKHHINALVHDLTLKFVDLLAPAVSSTLNDQGYK